MWMNEHDIDTALARHLDHPVLGPATRTLDSLRTAVNGCSDGWPFWQAPAKAARALMELIQAAEAAERDSRRGMPAAEDMVPPLRIAYAQLRAFRTRRARVGGIEFRIFPAPGVDGDPEPEQPAAPVQHQIRIEVRGDKATVTVTGGSPLPTGRYMGAVVKLSDRRGAAA